MELTLTGHNCLYQVEQLQQALFGVDAPGAAVSEVRRQEDGVYFITTITIGDKTTTATRQLSADNGDIPTFYRLLRQSYFEAAVPHLPEYPAWGALAGVRPTKISTRYLLDGHSIEETDRLLQEQFYVTPQRRELALHCSVSSLNAVNQTQEQDISLYIGIPFCPTRCSYCSFVSRTVGKKTALLDQYFELLLKEIAVTGKLLKQSGRTVRTIYIGGGTPTTLSAPQLEQLLQAIKMHMDLSHCIEFTVEAGRPDTLTPEKFQILKRCGANRVSINPQTMVDDVLRACGRPHTAQDVRKGYADAQRAGFTDINMDLIAGLPQDTLEGFKISVDELIAMNPANITIHTLALKKGADLFTNRQALPERQTVSAMLSYASQRLTEAGYKPYYLYRQKYMSGNYENIGWSRDNRDCLYNIYMMEELHSIISLGGGGMSKINLPDNKLQRFNNPKFPEQYVQQFDTVLAQKQELFQLLTQN